MGSFTFTVAPFANLPPRPLIVPCYHCQVREFRIPLKYRPLHTLLLKPDSPLLPLHFKLEDLHFEFHNSEAFSKYYNSKPGVTTLSSDTFFHSLAQVWVKHLEVISTLIDNSEDPKITAVSLHTYVTEQLRLN